MIQTSNSAYSASIHINAVQILSVQFYSYLIGSWYLLKPELLNYQFREGGCMVHDFMMS